MQESGKFLSNLSKGAEAQLPGLSADILSRTRLSFHKNVCLQARTLTIRTRELKNKKKFSLKYNKQTVIANEILKIYST